MGTARGRKRRRTVRNGLGDGYIYNRMRALRCEREISREQMAADLCLGSRTLGYLEREQYAPTLRLAYEISEYFQVPLEFVFSREPLKPMSQLIYATKDLQNS